MRILATMFIKVIHNCLKRIKISRNKFNQECKRPILIKLLETKEINSTFWKMVERWVGAEPTSPQNQ